MPTPVLMDITNYNREWTFPRPVGTRGGCGAGWGPCACPSWQPDAVGISWCLAHWR